MWQDAVGGLNLGLRRRLPVVLQTEAAECGLACLAMVAGYHGHRVDLATLRGRFSISLKGTTLAALIRIADRMHLATRAVRLEPRQLAQLRRPCIVHWRMDHFVVLKSVRARSVRIHDPAGGERSVSMRELSEAFTGVALELWPRPQFEPRRESPRVKLRDLIGRVEAFRRSLGQIVLLTLVLEVFAIATPLLLQWVIDHVLVSANRDLLATLALGFGLLLVLQHAIATLRAWVIMHFGTTLNVQWYANVFAHMLRLPMAYFEKRHLGDIVSRFRSIDAIQRGLTSAFIEAVVDGLMAVSIVALMLLYSPILSAACAAAMALYATSRWIWYRPLRLATEEQIVHAAQQESHFLETVRGARIIKLFQRENERRSSWLSLVVDQANAAVRTEKLQILYKLLNGLLFGAENILVIWLGAGLVLDGRFTVGMLMAFMAYKAQFALRVSALIDRFCELKMLQIQGERLADIVMTAPEPGYVQARLASADDAAPVPAFEVRGVRFRYGDNEPYVLDGVDLRIEAGESVAIVGASGCGKTTLLHVLLGILAPTEGDVVIGGVGIAAAGPEVARRMIGSVTQNDTLFAGTIADNICFFDPRPDQRHVEACARLAAIHHEVVAMPMGYNTHVGYLGSVLSGGQQQRVLLARAFYRRPKILVLDEATSHLDLKLEILVNAAIRALNVTRIVVAHRPQTVDNVDRVVTLAGGRIVADRRLSPNVAALREAALAPREADRGLAVATPSADARDYPCSLPVNVYSGSSTHS